MEARIKYWNHKRGDKKVKLSWDNYDDFFTWLDKFDGRIKGGFSIRVEGAVCIINYTGSTESVKSYILTVIKAGNRDVKK